MMNFMYLRQWNNYYQIKISWLRSKRNTLYKCALYL